MGFFRKEAELELEPDVDSETRLMRAVKELNDAWREARSSDDKFTRSLRPWIIWSEKRIVLSRFVSTSEVVYDPDEDERG